MEKNVQQLKGMKDKLRSKYKISSGNYYIYESGTTNSVMKTLGTNKAEQGLIADQMVKRNNMHDELLEAVKYLHYYLSGHLLIHGTNASVEEKMISIERLVKRAEENKTIISNNFPFTRDTV